MEPFFSVGVAFAGFLLGTVAFSRIGHWLVGIHSAVKARRGSHSGAERAALASAVFLASGPWLLVALLILAFGVSSLLWSLWLFGGFGASILFFGGVTVYLAHKSARTAKQNAV